MISGYESGIRSGVFAVALGDWVKSAASKAAAKLDEGMKVAAAAAEKHRQERAAQAAAEAQRNAAAAVEQKRQQEIWKQAEERIPERWFPRHPPILVEDGWNPVLHREDWWEWWEHVLRWPAELPKTEIERQRREGEWWENQLANATIKDENGNDVLRDKQTIIEYWWQREKWLAREYYAATGVVIDVLFTKQILTNLKNSIEYNRKVKDERNSRTSAGPSVWVQALNEASSRTEQFNSNVVPQHKEKWGNWFFFHIEQAHKKKYAEPERKFTKPSDDL